MPTNIIGYYKTIQLFEKQTVQVGIEPVEARIIDFLSENVEDEKPYLCDFTHGQKKILAFTWGQLQKQ